MNLFTEKWLKLKKLQLAQYTNLHQFSKRRMTSISDYFVVTHHQAGGIVANTRHLRNKRHRPQF